MRRPSPATIIATVALFIALGGVGVAANGDNFILGKANTASKQTSLTGAAPNPQLQVENTSTDGNARGVVGLISSSAASAGSAGVAGTTASTDPGSVGVLAQNTGGGPALMAAVDPGAPPLAVSSSAKVTNLNADQLDGMNSTAFLGVNGTAANANKLDGLDSTQFLGVNATAANANKLDGLDSTQFVSGGGSVSAIHVETGAAVGGVPLGNPGGVVRLLANCFDNSGGQTGTQITLQNISGEPLTVLREGSQGATTVKALAPNDTDTDMPVLTADHFKWHAHFGDTALTIDTWSYFDGNNCFFDVRSTFDPSTS